MGDRGEQARAWQGPIGDQAAPREILASSREFDGRVWSVHSQDISWDGSTIRRDVVHHLGAVAVVVLDENERVLLIRQYRHPVGMLLAEIPAGLLDVSDEDPLITAQRELAEEAGLVALQWQVLIDFLNSPGGSSEALRIYLARDIAEISGGRPHTGEAEEADLPQAWVSLDDAVALILAGRIQNAAAVCGILGAHVARESGWGNLRDAHAPWPARDHLMSSGRVHSMPLTWEQEASTRPREQGSIS